MNNTSTTGTSAGPTPVCIEDLKKLPIWVAFDIERAMDKDGNDILNADGTFKTRKLPRNPRTGALARASDSRTWSTYDKAAEFLAKHSGGCLGFALDGRGLCGIDLDHHLSEDGAPDDFARGILDRTQSYTEISPSGRGLHIITIDADPSNIGVADKSADTAIEVYRTRPRTRDEMQALFEADQKSREPKCRCVEDVGDIEGGRFLTYTGNVYGEARPFRDCTDTDRELIAEILARKPRSGKSILSDSEVRKKASTQADPLKKKGIVGAYCRAHGIREVIETELSSVYEAGSRGRYTYTAGSSLNGVVIYQGVFCYSFHASDPAGGVLCNSFDIARIHKFGDLDGPKDSGVTAPSYKAMVEWLADDPKVKAEIDAVRTAEIAVDFSDTDDPEWRDKLERNKQGDIIPSARNIARILLNDKELRDIKENSFSGYYEAGKLPWKRHGTNWDDADDSNLLLYLSRTYGIEPQERLIRAAFTSVAGARGYNPVKEYLDHLPAWDGVPRVDTLLTDFLGADDTPYTRAVMRKTLVAAVRRIREPGVKFDYVLVLCGEQGVCKSMFFEKLGGKYASDSLSWNDIRDKSGSEKLSGVWIMEVGELSGMRRAEIETVKKFISARYDDYRVPFDRRVSRHMRQCIIVGSTNSDTGFLRDTTGNRRWWPVNITGVGRFSVFKDLDDQRDQIWSEAVMYEAAGEELILQDEEVVRAAEAAQRGAMEHDARQGLVEEYLNTKLPTGWYNMSLTARATYFDSSEQYRQPGEMVRQTVSALEIWCECFLKDKASFNRQRDGADIALIMAGISGWKKTNERPRLGEYGQQRIYRRIQTGTSNTQSNG